ncbi:MAG: NAD-dependent epimerase/dehydratase family protein [Deltaproteobacteria bacterium]|nr:MAG: NAD-dependent epimerase/dehydratase family protein [Deltaproteobacteria bacterium]
MGQHGQTIAVTGACSYLGQRLLERLDSDRRWARVLALDVRPPPIPLDKCEYRRIDLTIPTVDGELAELFRAEGVDAVVHGAFLSHPTHATAWAHELEDIGTMHLLNACAEVPPSYLLLLSTTMVYGPHADNPNFLTEDHPLRGVPRSRWINDKVSAERQVARFADEQPEVTVGVLRFAPILGPTVSNFYTRFFSRPVAPVLMGYDPLMQFVHETDAADALDLAVAARARGPFNIVGDGVLPYRTILALMGKVPVPLPRPVAYSVSRALWATQVLDTPPNFLDYLRFLCVADGTRAAVELGFSPRYDIKATIQDFLGVADADGATDIARAQG